MARIKTVQRDVVQNEVALELRGCDFVFLAADSMRARLLFNALVHQYLIPGVQVGVKVKINSEGDIVDVHCANRPVRPGKGCLWCNGLIDPTILAKEMKTDEDRRNQEYGTATANPSVITLNAVSCSLAVNDFLFDFLGLRTSERTTDFVHYYPVAGRLSVVEPRSDVQCPECSVTGKRYARGDTAELPTAAG